MTTSVRARITLPDEIRSGEAFEVRTLLLHPMETGQRVDFEGRVVPRQIVDSFEARLGGELVWSARLYPAIAANPYLAFWLRVDGAGELRLEWRGDAGFVHHQSVLIKPR